MRFAKPLDTDLLRRLATEHELLLTVEDGSIGGFAAHVMTFLANEGLMDKGLKVRPMTLPDRFVAHNSPTAQYDDSGLNAPHIAAAILKTLGRNNEAEGVARA